MIVQKRPRRHLGNRGSKSLCRKGADIRIYFL
jgi:hypothetical protein